MAESARRLLGREFSELLAGQRDGWSARAVVRAAKLLREAGDDSGERRHLLVELINIDPNGDGLWHTHDDIRSLESRAWLFSVDGVMPSSADEDEWLLSSGDYEADRHE